MESTSEKFRTRPRFHGPERLCKSVLYPCPGGFRDSIRSLNLNIRDLVRRPRLSKAVQCIILNSSVNEPPRKLPDVIRRNARSSALN